MFDYRDDSASAETGVRLPAWVTIFFLAGLPYLIFIALVAYGVNQ